RRGARPRHTGEGGGRGGDDRARVRGPDREGDGAARSPSVRRRRDPMTRVVVTGGSGSAGRVVVRDLLEHGAEVVSVDISESPELACEQRHADLADLGATVEALAGAEAVVHLAAIPAPGLLPDDVTYRVNTTSTYNVFSAAATLGVRRVVWASTAMVMGLPFEHGSPAYVPLDEEHPLR